MEFQKSFQVRQQPQVTQVSASRAVLLMRIKVFAGPGFLQSRGHLASGSLILCPSLWIEECFVKELASPMGWQF